MPPEERDAGLLWDMLRHAKALQTLMSGVTLQDYLADEYKQWTVERLVEIIGEAARRVSPAFKARHSDIAWQGIVGQRNVVAHEYGNIEHDRLWIIATRRVPELVAKLENLLPPIPPKPAS